ncbi:hypothetical protein Hypma_011290 [Hypsizygus marmoreus]|uniref:Uncharacterized protein n=1 Tax=Hypsizygus marmoreus TaxID=39966 RepID=A0A369JPV9_HYPMA|nr:hypothetical protein Hypma_011290 [Hypsizygus marmoreus]
MTFSSCVLSLSSQYSSQLHPTPQVLECTAHDRESSSESPDTSIKSTHLPFDPRPLSPPALHVPCHLFTFIAKIRRFFSLVPFHTAELMKVNIIRVTRRSAYADLYLISHRCLASDVPVEKRPQMGIGNGGLETMTEPDSPRTRFPTRPDAFLTSTVPLPVTYVAAAPILLCDGAHNGDHRPKEVHIWACGDCCWCHKEDEDLMRDEDWRQGGREMKNRMEGGRRFDLGRSGRTKGGVGFGELAKLSRNPPERHPPSLGIALVLSRSLSLVSQLVDPHLDLNNNNAALNVQDSISASLYPHPSSHRTLRQVFTLSQPGGKGRGEDRCETVETRKGHGTAA